MRGLCRGAVIAGLAALLAAQVWAKDKPYNPGTITSMTSSDCGYDAKGENAVLGAVLGTDGGQAHKAKVLLCQDYTLKTEAVVYKIRPKKEHAQLLPVNAAVEFRIDRDKMKLRLAGDKHDMEFAVISQQAAEPAEQKQSDQK